MTKPNSRRQVTYQPGNTNVPMIRLTGYYLQNLCGFAIGDTVQVEYRRGEIIIRRPEPTQTELLEVQRKAIVAELDRVTL